MVKFLWGLAREVRPRQWIKNFALYAGLIFAGQLNNPPQFWLITQGFFIFCGLTSAIYILNDIFDIERDRQHPFKSLRPIASGLISVPIALVIAFGLITVLLPIAFQLSPPLFYMSVLYLLLQVLYSAYLKSTILLDVMVIAAGFVIRVYAGVLMIDAHLNVWFLLSIISFSLFLAIGKRRSERTLMQTQASKHRETLLHYPADLLDILTSMFANSAWLTYALFAFQQAPVTLNPQFVDLFSPLSYSLSEAKYLMVTVPIVIYGVMRYLYIIYEKKEGESPERVLLTDVPLLSTVLLWLVIVILVIYYIGG